MSLNSWIIFITLQRNFFETPCIWIMIWYTRMIQSLLLAFIFSPLCHFASDLFIHLNGKKVSLQFYLNQDQNCNAHERKLLISITELWAVECFSPFNFWGDNKSIFPLYLHFLACSDKREIGTDRWLTTKPSQ